MAAQHPSDSQLPGNHGGRPPTLKPEHIAALHDIVEERAQASLQEIADELHHRQSDGSSSVRTRGLNAGVARSCITTASLQSRLLGSGSRRRVCYSVDSPIRFDFAYLL